MVPCISNSTLSLSPGMRDLFPAMVAAMGGPRFGSAVTAFVREACEADHILAFRSAKLSPEIIFNVSRDGSATAQQITSRYMANSYWHDDLPMAATLQNAAESGWALNRYDITTLPKQNYLAKLFREPRICERIIFSGDVDEHIVGIVLLRAEKTGLVDHSLLQGLSGLSDILFPLINKHADILQFKSDFHGSLTCLAKIERVLGRSESGLTRRERQVCARTLFSVSTVGIAEELGIGEETVITHRKKAYQRLSLSTRHELLLWYLKSWSQVSEMDDGGDSAVPRC